MSALPRNIHLRRLLEDVEEGESVTGERPKDIQWFDNSLHCVDCQGDKTIFIDIATTELYCIRCGKRKGIYVKQTPVPKPKKKARSRVADIRIRMVKVLSGRAKEEADKMGLKEDDLVIVRMYIKKHQLPTYKLEKIEGNPLEYLQNNLR